MSLKNIVSRDFVSCSPSATVHEVARLMRDWNVGAVLVIQSGIPTGIITDRDLVLRCVAEQAECETTKVESVMTRVVQTVSDQDGIYDVAKKMKTARVRRVPVVNSSGKAVGLLSFDDVFQLLGEEMYHLKEAIQPIEPKIVGRAA